MFTFCLLLYQTINNRSFNRFISLSIFTMKYCRPFTNSCTSLFNIPFYHCNRYIVFILNLRLSQKPIPPITPLKFPIIVSPNTDMFLISVLIWLRGGVSSHEGLSYVFFFQKKRLVPFDI